jgi:hypothetical protein
LTQPFAKGWVDNTVCAWNNEDNMFRNKNVLLIGSIVLIVLAIGLVTLLERTSSSTATSTDVRARAAVAKTLQVNATVISVDETKGLITVSDLYFADVSRSGEAKNLGTWVVTPPPTFGVGSLSPGTSVVIGVDAASFLVSEHTLTAVTITPAAR